MIVKMHIFREFLLITSWVCHLDLVPFRLLPFRLFPFRLLPFRLLWTINEFPFRLLCTFCQQAFFSYFFLFLSLFLSFICVLHVCSEYVCKYVNIVPLF